MADRLTVAKVAEFSSTPEGKMLQAGALYLVALVFGGGGSGAGLANLVVQLAALALLAFNASTALGFFRSAPRVPAILVGLSLALPLLQSVPLPPAVWQSLPGRDLMTQSLELVGGQNDWRPMSLDVHRTLLAFFSLVPLFVALVLTWQLPGQQKFNLMVLVAVTGGLVVLIGAQQLVSDNRRFVFYAEAYGTGDLQGTFANRNSVGLYLDLCLCALVGVFPKRRPGLKWIAGSLALAALLLVGLVLTRSRSSMALSLVPFAFAAFRIVRSRFARRFSRPALLAGLLGLALVGGAGVFLASQNQRVQNSLERFDDLHDRRPAIWADTVQAIHRYWPLGSGIGSFDEVFQIDESLESIAPGRAARAHDDYLEITLESGIVGVVLAVSWVLFLLSRSVSALRCGGLSQIAAVGFAVVAFQSISDYPLRNQTLLCLAGLLLALVINPPLSIKDGNALHGRKTRRSR